jgi:hypothetical protein
MAFAAQTKADNKKSINYLKPNQQIQLFLQIEIIT